MLDAALVVGGFDPSLLVEHPALFPIVRPTHTPFAAFDWLNVLLCEAR